MSFYIANLWCVVPLTRTNRYIFVNIQWERSRRRWWPTTFIVFDFIKIITTYRHVILVVAGTSAGFFSLFCMHYSQPTSYSLIEYARNWPKLQWATSSSRVLGLREEDRGTVAWREHGHTDVLICRHDCWTYASLSCTTRLFWLTNWSGTRMEYVPHWQEGVTRLLLLHAQAIHPDQR